MQLRSIAQTTVALAGFAATAFAAAPASASTAPAARPSAVAHLSSDIAVRPDAGWLGACEPANGPTWGGGWCDGNGPNWVYEGYVECQNGLRYYGPVRWAGDRRGSFGQCPAGLFIVDGTAAVLDWYQ